MTQAQFCRHRGDWLFTELMTDEVYCLTKSYRSKSKKSKDILSRVRTRQTTSSDADDTKKLHQVFHRYDTEFTNNVENDDKTMWSFARNDKVQKI